MGQINIELVKYMYAKNTVKSGKAEIKIISDCMVPLVDTGDRVEVIACPKYRRGDIVAVFINNQMFLHRIITVTDTTVITKGDRAFGKDPEVNKECIIGLLNKNLSKEMRILRRKVIAVIIARISNLEARVFSSMEKVGNHKRLKTIYRMRKFVERLNKYCMVTI